jgi:hypothetical protein
MELFLLSSQVITEINQLIIKKDSRDIEFSNDEKLSINLKPNYVQRGYQ